jgi:hypothetical protein
MFRVNAAVVGLALLLIGTAFAGRGRGQAAQAFPIVDVTNNCLIGGAAGGRWVEAAAMAKQMRGGEKYRLYDLAGFVAEGAGGKPESAGAPCDETQVVKINPVPQSKRALIAIGGTWNASPRAVTVLNNSNAGYRQAIGGLLKTNGIAETGAVLNQVLRVDLEGDGQDEVLLGASKYTGGLGVQAKAGDYSIVLLRKIANGKVESIPVVAEYHRSAGDDAPNEYRILAVLDVNGDGVMEIIVYSRYYEGDSTSIYSVNGTRVEDVLNCGCGA